MARQNFRSLPTLITIAVLAVGGYYVKVKYIDTQKKETMSGGTTGGTTMSSDNSSSGGGDSVSGTGADTSGGVGTQGGAVDKPTFGLENDANAKARRDVLARIDLMPHLTEQQKAKLTTSVDRARGMGCIFVIPFEGGKKALGPRESEILAKGFQSASIQKLMEDPTLVFVVLGYADKGDAQSEKISIDRAQSVLGSMKERCNVQNVMYSVGMGASSANAQQMVKNRLVEVWAVYP